MKRTRADGVALILLSVLLLAGGLVTWQAYRQWVALEEMGNHMGMSATAVHGTHPLWYLIGTIVVVSVVGGVYVLVRERLIDEEATTASPDANKGTSRGVDPTDTPITSGPAGGRASASDVPDRDRRVLDLLPEDERRVLEPVLESPGLTQIALRDRSNFSKSKVSQTVTDLEKRGLLYREPQGRTYRVYPADDLALTG
ncbi:helix-turn-helix transcriptional regulator [Natronosalvus vescus]|uniref:helix-turn-helix transcriptional regulator n=1 Tax=Natronosalvus vescus TaxID=2953881 RepID=UPI0020903DBB|nr:MarR family transcriptional regulator [Natronosalvus vescus]